MWKNQTKLGVGGRGSREVRKVWVNVVGVAGDVVEEVVVVVVWRWRWTMVVTGMEDEDVDIGEKKEERET